MRSDRQSSVYFISAAGAGLIKIGISVDPLRRIAQLQTWSPVLLNLLAFAPGRQREESAIHTNFLEDWSHGEWFFASEKLLHFIEVVKVSGAVPKLEIATVDSRDTKFGRSLSWTPERRARQSELLKQHWSRQRESERRMTTARTSALFVTAGAQP